MLSKELEISINRAFQYARAESHEFVTVEHLLWALIDSPKVVPILKACGANIDTLRDELQHFIEETIPPMLEPEQETQPTLGFQRVIQRAVFQVQSSEQPEVAGSNILVAIFSEKESQALFLLEQHFPREITNLLYHNHAGI